MSNIEQILEERNNNYGEFAGHAQITQDIKDIMHNSPQWKNLNASKRETLEMVAHKMGRILNGNPEYKDSWTDIIGYTKLVEKTLK